MQSMVDKSLTVTSQKPKLMAEIERVHCTVLISSKILKKTLGVKR